MQTVYIDPETRGKEENRVPAGRQTRRTCAGRAGCTTHKVYAPMRFVGPLMKMAQPVFVLCRAWRGKSHRIIPPGEAALEFASPAGGVNPNSDPARRRVRTGRAWRFIRGDFRL